MNPSPILDELAVRLALGHDPGAVDDLCHALRDRLDRLDDAGWEELCLRARAHPIQRLLREDPYTRRALDKPRGYAGDAVMLDYVYDGVCPARVSPVGRAVFQGTTGSSCGRSIAGRRDLLARVIDEEAAARGSLRALALACGHLREVERSAAVTDGLVELLAVDQDEHSLDVVARRHATRRVRPCHASVRDVVTGGLGAQRFDLIYAAGLYDQMPDPVARLLTRTLAARLTPGGRLLVGNFTPEASGRGYMECFMDWCLLYRTREDLAELVPEEPGLEHRVFLDDEGNVAYLDLRRVG